MPAPSTFASPSRTPTSFDRRSFLRGALAGLGASAIAGISGARRAEATTSRLRTAYRLSTHGRRVCSACKGHAANRFYSSHDGANKGRAHLGCNCGIVTHDIPVATWNCYFAGGKKAVYDQRWRTPRCPRV